MKKQKNKQVIKASKLAKAENMKKKVITVQNAEGEPETQAEILIQNKIGYTPKVSVIIPVYNVEEYLRECLDSIVKQTLREIEIICVDDGSTDNSLGILKEYALKDNRITVITQKNLHAGVARNAGLAVARGEYLSFLDSDDFFELNMLEEMYEKAHQEMLDVIICKCKIFDEIEKKIDENKFNYTLHEEYFTKNIVAAVEIKNKIFQICQGWAWDKLFNRNFVLKYRVKFQNIINTNDAYFVYLLLCLAKKISYLSKKLVYKRYQNASSLTNTRNKAPDCYIYAIEGILDRLNYHKLYNTFGKSLWEWGISLSIIQLKTLQDDGKRKLYGILHNKFNQWNIIDNSSLDTNRGRAINYIMNNEEFPELTIAYATNKKFFDLCLVSIVSILKNAVFEKINIIILHTELTQEEENKISELKNIRNFDYTFSHVNGKTFEKFPLVWTSQETWYRCLLADMFPQYKKILYLDSDTIVRKSLLSLWQTDMTNKLIAAVEDISQSKEHSHQLNLLDNFYFNAGVLLLNTEEWRKNNFCKKIFSYVENNQVFQADQGTLNKLTDLKKIKLSPEYNYMEVWWRENICQYSEQDILIYNKKNPTIVHFTGIKPNNTKCGNSFKNEFNLYYQQIMKNQIKIPIILSSDNNYAPYMYVTMVSMLENADKSTFYDYYLLVPSAFSAKNTKLINQLKEKYNCDIHFIDMKNAFSDLKMQISHITSPTYYRLLAADILPQKYEKCIYLDVDVCVCKDLSELYNMDLKDNYVAGVVAAGYYFNEKAHCKRLNLVTMKQYVNAGVLLMNLKQIRQNNMTQKFVELSKENYSSQDQDVINVSCHNKIKLLPPKYNVMTQRIYENDRRLRELFDEKEIKEARENPVIIHYADKIKPWNSLSVYMGAYWWKYANIIGMKYDYKKELQIWYQKVTGKYLNLDNPQSFNEKIQWLKLYDSTPIKTRLADKHLVREWVKEKIGEQYLIPLLGVYDKFEEIDFSKLPNQYVIKCNHGCSYNIIVKDKTKLDLTEVKTKLDKWMNENFAFKIGYELHYRDIKPKIIIEKYIENKGADDLYDYKFWCFDGKVAYIQFLSERNLSGLKMAFYDKNWIKQSFVYSYPLDTKKIEKPDNLDKMIQLAEILSKGFPHVRVDFYRLNDGTIYLGEMTFTSASGSCKWNDEKINIILGNMIKLPKFAYNIDTGEYYKLPKKSKIKPYLLLPYNLCQKIYLKRKEQTLNKRSVQKQLTGGRIDIKNFGNANNAVEITTSAKISAPAWFANAQGQGQVVETNKKIQNITIKTIQDGKLVLSFKGQDKRFEGTRFPLWIDYKSIKIDGKEILSAPIVTWHDKPFRYEMPVKDGQVVKVEVVQQYHQYSKEELKNVILKLNPNSDYINVNINKLTKKIYKKITVKMTTSNSTLQKTLFTKAKQNIQARIKLWRDKLSFAHKLTPVIDLMHQNQIQTLKMLRDIQARNENLENKNNELKNEVEVLKSTFNTQLSELKKQQEENTKQLIATGDKFFAEFSRAMEEFQNYGISEISEIKNYYADFAYQLGNTEVRLLNELSMQRETAQQNKNNIISGINQTEQSLHTQVAKFQEMVQEQQAVLDSVQKSLEDLSGLKEIDFAQQEELKSLTKELETQKSHLMKEVQNLQNKVQRQYQELNFADLLHDSTKDSPWLKDRSFALYGWAANYSFIYTLFRILDNIRPAYILEMGLGQTSLVTSQYIANNNPEADLDIIENDTDWINVYRSKLAQHKNIRLHQCDIEFFDYAGEKNRKYKDLHKITQEKKYNLILVDGPIGGAQKFPRSNIVDLVQQNLAEDFIIIFDDAERSGEQNTIAKTKEKLSVMGIDFGVQQRNALKSQVLIFSKSCEFAKYL